MTTDLSLTVINLATTPTEDDRRWHPDSLLTRAAREASLRFPGLVDALAEHVTLEWWEMLPSWQPWQTERVLTRWGIAVLAKYPALNGTAELVESRFEEAVSKVADLTDAELLEWTQVYAALVRDGKALSQAFEREIVKRIENGRVELCEYRVSSRPGLDQLKPRVTDAVRQRMEELPADQERQWDFWKAFTALGDPDLLPDFRTTLYSPDRPREWLFVIEAGIDASCATEIRELLKTVVAGVAPFLARESESTVIAHYRMTAAYWLLKQLDREEALEILRKLEPQQARSILASLITYGGLNQFALRGTDWLDLFEHFGIGGRALNDLYRAARYNELDGIAERVLPYAIGQAKAGDQEWLSIFLGTSVRESEREFFHAAMLRLLGSSQWEERLVGGVVASINGMRVDSVAQELGDLLVLLCEQGNFDASHYVLDAIEQLSSPNVCSPQIVKALRAAAADPTGYNNSFARLLLFGMQHLSDLDFQTARGDSADDYQLLRRVFYAQAEQSAEELRERFAEALQAESFDVRFRALIELGRVGRENPQFLE
jgi:hypothetical protein